MFTQGGWVGPFWVSVRVAFFGGLVAMAFGTAAALGMRRLARGRGARVARSRLIMPMALPLVAYALGVYQLSAKLPAAFGNTLIPLILAEATMAMPLVYVIVAGALAGVDPRLSRVASTMGARWPTILWRVELPLIKMALVGAFVFVFASIFDEATLALFLAPPTDTTLAQALYNAATQAIQPTLSAVSTMITALALIVLGLATVVIRLGGRATQGAVR